MGSDLIHRKAVGGVRALWERLRIRRFRRLFQNGSKISRFLAPDVIREIKVLDDSLADEGRVIARVRTFNVLHAAKGIQSEPEYGAPEIVNFSDVWKWNGEKWRGSVDPEMPSIPVIDAKELERLLAAEFPAAAFEAEVLLSDYGSWRLAVSLDGNLVEFVWAPFSGFGGINLSLDHETTPFDYCDEYLHSMSDALSFAKRHLSGPGGSGRGPG